LSDYEKYSALYAYEYSFDNGHLNKEGAGIFTELLFDEYQKKFKNQSPNN